MDLAELITTIHPEADEEPEDIFAYALGLIFTDDVRNMHGDPDSTVVYKSKRFGDIRLRTSDPDHESERLLFAHYLWNAGIRMAEIISQEDNPRWSVKGETVLELGAGVGLVGIVATLAGAEHVVISDYPALLVLENIRQNAARAINESMQSRYLVQGYAWGDTGSDFALCNANKFSRIVAADCYWMPNEHENLVKSMLHFLSHSPQSRVLVIAGFHTGRSKLAAFFDIADSRGLCAEEIYEEHIDGHTREWLRERDGGTEHTTERKKWLVIARLMRRGQ